MLPTMMSEYSHFTWLSDRRQILLANNSLKAKNKLLLIPNIIYLLGQLPAIVPLNK
jgi:hypothetical protein